MFVDFNAIKEGYDVGDNLCYAELDSNGDPVLRKYNEDKDKNVELNLSKDAAMFAVPGTGAFVVLKKDFLIKVLDILNK